MIRTFLLVVACFLFSFSSFSGKKKYQVVEIKTSHGVIYVWLYKDTPKHANNFIKLAKKDFFDSTTFHRVIKGFMIQGGDPFSRMPEKKDSIGEGGPGYELPAEFGHSHKKGVIAAARNGDLINPEQKSSGCQFYIVQGKTYTDAELDFAEQRINGWKKDDLFYRMLYEKKNKTDLEAFMRLAAKNRGDSLAIIKQKYQAKVDSLWAKITPYKFTPQQRELYKTAGGAAHLDNNYTAFGEVIKGLEIVDEIASVATTGPPTDRPLKNVTMDVNIIRYNKAEFIKTFGIDPDTLP
jgi:cyclophilin family peptidyl-prolyl cis-trans isomerase